jgi:hypothetical protein
MITDTAALPFFGKAVLAPVSEWSPDVIGHYSITCGADASTVLTGKTLEMTGIYDANWIDRQSGKCTTIR